MVSTGLPVVGNIKPTTGSPAFVELDHRGYEQKDVHSVLLGEGHNGAPGRSYRSRHKLDEVSGKLAKSQQASEF